AALDLAAYVLTGAKNSRLTKEMVYEDQTASSVSAFQDGKRLAGEFMVIATARPGTTLPTLQQTIDAEIARLAADGPTARELEQAQNAFEAGFLDGLESVGRKADRLNAYYYQLGVPDAFQRDIDRYRAVSADDVR